MNKNEIPVNENGTMRRKMNVIPYDLIPFQEITDAYSEVAEVGSGIYKPWNWSNGLSRVQLLGSLLRHTFAYLRGQDNDKETGLSHTSHILWNAVTLCHNVHHNLEDGRRKEPYREYLGDNNYSEKDVSRETKDKPCPNLANLDTSWITK